MPTKEANLFIQNNYITINFRKIIFSLSSFCKTRNLIGLVVRKSNVVYTFSCLLLFILVNNKCNSYILRIVVFKQ